MGSLVHLLTIIDPSVVNLAGQHLQVVWFTFFAPTENGKGKIYSSAKTSSPSPRPARKCGAARREQSGRIVLKGKPHNVWNLKRDTIYKNDEMYNLMRPLNVEDNPEGNDSREASSPPTSCSCAQGRDGRHLSNLMVTCFFRSFGQPVHSFLDALASNLYVPAHFDGI